MKPASSGERRPNVQIDPLTRRAMENVRKGLAPPADIYCVQNRNKVDWASLPQWARPADPELFLCHEG